MFDHSKIIDEHMFYVKKKNQKFKKDYDKK